MIEAAVTYWQYVASGGQRLTLTEDEAFQFYGKDVGNSFAVMLCRELVSALLEIAQYLP